MKILLVAHYFLPRHQAGTEIYTGLLAEQFRRRGHEVIVFASEDNPPGASRFKLIKDSWRGIPVYRLFRSEPPDFQRTYLDPEIDALFRDFLEKEKPDVVHFQHLFRLSAGMVKECNRAGIPAFITLADYWFICPPILLLQPGFKPCPGPEPERCAQCGNSIGALYAGTPGSRLAGSGNPALALLGIAVQKAAEHSLQSAHALKRKLPSSWVARARERFRKKQEQDPESALRKRREWLERRMEVMKEALELSELVFAPSRFLLEKMVEAAAVSPEKIVHSDYGFDHRPFQNLRRSRAELFRFGFIGTPVEHKGVHIAVEAMNLVRDLPAELLIYGELAWFPAYARRLKKLSRNPRTRFRGRFPNEQAARILAELDALIVPSLWFENSPLTIHEAFLAKTPVIVSGMGGMAELVSGGGGITFTPGDAEDLARVMRELVEHPERLSELRESIPPVKTIEDNVEELSGFYQKGLAAKK